MIAAIVCSVLFVACVLFIYWRWTKDRDAGTLHTVVGWPKSWVPLSLFIDETLASVQDKLELSFGEGVDFMNKGSGLELFVPLGDVGEGYTIAILPYLEKEDDAAIMSTKVTTDKDGILKEVVIYVDDSKIAEETSELVLIRAAAHELGHCLGLDHDVFPVSVMFPRARGGDFALTPKDKELLKALYDGRE